MKQIPFIPENAPFNAEQRAWLNGFLSGFYSNAGAATLEATTTVSASAVARGTITLLFGSQTGNAEALTNRLAKVAGQEGFTPQIVDMNKFASIDWSKESRLLIITSTYGEGEMPDNAKGFWAFLQTEAASRLAHLEFSILALGDTSYEQFCQAGKDFDRRLEELGAKRIVPRVDCDTEFEMKAQNWMKNVLQYWTGTTPATTNSAPMNEKEQSQSVQYDKKNPFPARLLVNRLLSGPGSGKETRHFEISLAGSGLTYEVGDALGVFPSNCPELVEKVIQAVKCDGEEEVKSPTGEMTSLRVALQKHYEITKISGSQLKVVLEKTGDERLKQWLDPANKAQLDEYINGRDLLDLLVDFKASWTAAELVTTLRKLNPRLYSISSSLKAHPNEVHLTVAVVRWESHGRIRKGICSTYLSDLAKENVPVFVHHAHGFGLPENHDTPIIMVGPGTGIAPFRAFLEERQVTGAKGKNWLFFGDQKAASDFLYREELEAMQKNGVLTRLDTAFSRDQAEKIYVQNRMLENAKELWQWLEAGAHFYVCGDAKRMAKDVDAALHQIIEKAGGKTPEQAKEYVQQLKTNKRYQRDVY